MITAIIVGAGHRALIYAGYALKAPDELRIVGVADPSPERRALAAQRFGLTAEQCFESAEELAARPKLADAVINGTMDRQHVPTTLPLLERGYDALLEKPFAVSEQELRLVDEETPEEIMISRENVIGMHERIKERLSKFEYQVLELYLKGYDYTQIAEKLGKQPKAIDNALQRIRSKVREVCS